MPDVTLEFIARQLERVLAEQRDMRTQLAVLPNLRDEIGLLREQVRIQGNAINRLTDTLSFNVLDRLRKLEADEN
jgi:hypothetical protein